MSPSNYFHFMRNRRFRMIATLLLIWSVAPLRLSAADLIIPRYGSSGGSAFTIGLLALGLLIGLLAYTIFLAISTGELMFIYFSIIMGLLTILQTFAAYDHFIFSLTYNRVTVITHLLFITFLLFFEDFFRLEEHAPRLSASNRITILIIAGYTIFFLLVKALVPHAVTFHTIIDFVRELFVFYTNIIFLYTIIKAIGWMRTEAIIILIAFIPPAVLTSINAMQIFPFMDRHANFVGFLMTYNQPIGLSLQAILFSLAMGNRYNRIKLERQQSIQERDKLQELDAQKTEFFMNMSHELRTPLTIILGMVQQVRQGKFGDSIHANDRVFAIIERNGLRLLKQVNHLLRLGTTGWQTEAEPIAIKPLISMIVDEFTPIARERGIRCSLLPTDDNHWSVSVTRDDVETVVMNLISNAVKFTPDGGSIEVSYASTEDGGLALSVKDTGIGLDTEEQRLIFNRWYRIHGQTNQYQTGLGLTLVKTIMEQYGGKVEVESIPQEGSTFTLHFPPTVVTKCSPSHDTSIHLPSGLEKLYTSDLFATKVTEEHTALSEDRATVLVVDDNRDMCAYIVSVLCESYRVVCANSGEEGLQRLEEHHVDIIICDIMMPAMDGHRFLAEIRRQYKENPIPLIFLTARDSVGEKIESLESGAVHYITKPFGANVLLATIARTLAHDREIITSKIEQIKKRIDEALEQITHPGSNQNASSLQRHIDRFVVESNLSSREQEVLQLILGGKSDKEIAITLNLSVKTVANHNRSLYRKAQVASRYELIARIYGYDS